MFCKGRWSFSQQQFWVVFLFIWISERQIERGQLDGQQRIISFQMRSATFIGISSMRVLQNFSISCKVRLSSSVTKLIATPLRPNRPPRPILKKRANNILKIDFKFFRIINYTLYVFKSSSFLMPLADYNYISYVRTFIIHKTSKV